MFVYMYVFRYLVSIGNTDSKGKERIRSLLYLITDNDLEALALNKLKYIHINPFILSITYRVLAWFFEKLNLLYFLKWSLQVGFNGAL